MSDEAGTIPRAYEGAQRSVPDGVVAGQVTAELLAEDVVVFVIGMRINRWRRLRSWLPTFISMPRMLRELAEQEDSPLLGVRTYWSGRVFMTVQYWRSLEELGVYARDSGREHAPMWGRFNRESAARGDVGIFHETYRITPDRLESLYANMPVFGLAAAQRAVPRSRSRSGDAHARMGQAA